MKDSEAREKVKCEVCGEKYPIITPSHLMTKHSMSLKAYKEKFPEAPITSAQYKARQKFLKGNLFVKEKVDPVIDEIDLQKLSFGSENRDNAETELLSKSVGPVEEKELFKELIESDENEEDEMKRLIVSRLDIKSPVIHDTPQIISAKLLILNFLKTVFPAGSVVSNFMIEKFHHEGLLQYQFITDIAIPSKKIDFEFISTFWHNSQVPDIHRNHKLERDGWTIIQISDIAVSADTVKAYLKHRRLI